MDKRKPNPELDTTKNKGKNRSVRERDIDTEKTPRRDEVDQAGVDSFPASDPTPFT